VCLFPLSVVFFLLLVTCLLSSCLYFPFLFISPLSFLLKIASFHFQAIRHRRRQNLGFKLSVLFCCCIFVFDDLYFVDLVSVDLVLC